MANSAPSAEFSIRFRVWRVITIDESDRMIQEALSELGCDKEPETIANKVKRQ